MAARSALLDVGGGANALTPFGNRRQHQRALGDKAQRRRDESQLVPQAGFGGAEHSYMVEPFTPRLKLSARRWSQANCRPTATPGATPKGAGSTSELAPVST